MSQTMNNSRFPVVAALAAMLLVLPAAAEAQGRGNGNGKRDRDRPELIRRDDDRDRNDRRSDDRDGDRRGPAFCRNGEGHPVHGMQWCRDKGFDRDSGWDILRQSDDRRDDDRRRDRRYDGDRRYDEYGRNGSYDRAHQEFHLRHDRQCRMMAAERPLDLQWQLRVRTQCKERHDEWHYRAGRRHG